MKNFLLATALLCFLFAACENKNTPAPASAFDEKKEQEAIMATIRQETECFYKGDYDCWKQAYAQTDYSFQAWNNPDSTVDAKTGWKAVDEKIGKYIRENPAPAGGSNYPKVERRNMIVKFYCDKIAWMSWDQYNFSNKRQVWQYSKETRVMEKMGGQWKIVSVAAFWDYKNEIAADGLK